MSRSDKILVALKNDQGIVRNVKVGFSWTVFFFGGVPFLFRGIPLYAIALMLPLVGGASGGPGIVIGFIIDVVIAFHANKWTAIYYIEHGYKPVGEGWDVANREWSLAEQAPK